MWFEETLNKSHVRELVHGRTSSFWVTLGTGLGCICGLRGQIRLQMFDLTPRMLQSLMDLWLALTAKSCLLLGLEKEGNSLVRHRLHSLDDLQPGLSFFAL